MADNDDDDQQQKSEEDSNSDDEPKTLKDELNVQDLSCCIFFKDQKLFSAAGPGLPVLQINTDGTFVSFDPDQPYRQEIDEEVLVRHDEHGRLFDALGEIRRLSGMKYRGKTLFFVKDRHPDNDQNLAAWFDDDMRPHYLYLNGNVLSAVMILRIRERMIDGELSAFSEISSD